MIKKLNSKYKISEIKNPFGYNELVYTERPKNLSELLHNSVSKYGELEAIIGSDYRLNYNQFASLIYNVARGLYHQYGIRKGDRISLMLRNGWEYAVIFFAIGSIGAIAVPLNTAFKGEEASFQINDSGSKMIFLDEEFIDVIKGIKSEIVNVKNIIVVGKRDFEDLLSYKTQKGIDIQVEETDNLVIMYTSGTTGRPKGAVLTHKGIIAEAMWISELFDWQPKRDKNLCPVPLFHVTGLVMDLCGAIFSGIPSVFMKKFSVLDTLKIIDKEKITTMIGVPTILWMMLNHPDFDQYNLESLRSYGAGGSATPEELVELCLKKLPNLNLCPGYGLTEACGMTLTTIDIQEALKYNGSSGRPIPLIDIKVVDEGGKELPFGIPGELIIRGCQLLKEYWNNPEATNRTLSEGWLHTGDIARIDDEGYVYILDRIKDMINRGGEKIWSLEVENVLYRNPKILEAAVIGVEDPVFGEEVKAVVVLKEGEKATSEEIQEFCSRYLAKFKIPKYIEFKESLPRNPAGKIIKEKLKH